MRSSAGRKTSSAPRLAAARGRPSIRWQNDTQSQTRLTSQSHHRPHRHADVLASTHAETRSCTGSGRSDQRQASARSRCSSESVCFSDSRASGAGTPTPPRGRSQNPDVAEFSARGDRREQQRRRRGEGLPMSRTRGRFEEILRDRIGETKRPRRFASAERLRPAPRSVALAWVWRWRTSQLAYIELRISATRLCPTSPGARRNQLATMTTRCLTQAMYINPPGEELTR